MDPKKIKSKDLIYLAVLLILFVALRFNSFSAPFERDEGEYAYSAWIMRNGSMPYRNAFLQKPPLIIYTYIFSQFLSSTALWPPRLLASIFTLISTFLVALIAKSIFGKKYFWPTALVFTPMIMLPTLMPFSANTEIFMLTPLLGFLYLYTTSHPNPKASRLFLAGILSSLALLYKPICLYVVVFISLLWGRSILKSQKSLLHSVKLFLFLLLGGAVTTLIILAPFLLTQTFKDLFQQVIVFNGYYAKSWGLGLGGITFQFSRILKYYWPLAIISLVFFINPPKKWWLPLGLTFSSILAIYQSYIGHYYLLLMPFWSLMLSYSLVKLSGFKGLAKRNVKPEALVAIAVITMLFPIRVQFTHTPEELNLWVYGTANPFYEAPLVARKLSEITTPTDPVFIAGSEPEILFYAKRISTSKFVITYPLIIDTPKRLDYQKEAIQELKNKPPQAIVLSRRQHSGLWNEDSPREFIDYLLKSINKDYNLIGSYVWIRNKGYWLEDPKEEELAASSLILYKKND